MINQTDIDAMAEEETSDLTHRTRCLSAFMKTLKPSDFVPQHIGSLISRVFFAGWKAGKAFSQPVQDEKYTKQLEDFIIGSMGIYEGVKVQCKWREDTPLADPSGTIRKLLLSRK